MAVSEKQFLQAVEACYAAAVEPGGWTHVCDAISSLGGAAGTTLLALSGPSDLHPRQPYSESLGELAESYFRDGWWKSDFRVRGFPAMRKRGFMVEHDFTTPEEIAREPYYQELMIPAGFGWFAGVGFSAGETSWCAAMQRGGEPFTHEELGPVLALVPHLNRAGAVAAALGFAGLSERAAALDAVGLGVIGLDGGGRVVLANQKAEALCRDVFTTRKGRLRAARGADDPPLQALLLAALKGTAQAATMAPGPVVLTRPGARPVLVEAMPLGRDLIGPFSRAQALLIATDLGLRLHPPTYRLRAVFSLTAAEARLAARLATGESLDDAAEALGIAKATARVQLRSVFAKTDSRRQAELVALLARMCGPPSRD